MRFTSEPKLKAKWAYDVGQEMKKKEKIINKF